MIDRIQKSILKTLFRVSLLFMFAFTAILFESNNASALYLFGPFSQFSYSTSATTTYCADPENYYPVCDFRGLDDYQSFNGGYISEPDSNYSLVVGQSVSAIVAGDSAVAPAEPFSNIEITNTSAGSDFKASQSCTNDNGDNVCTLIVTFTPTIDSSQNSTYCYPELNGTFTCGQNANLSYSNYYTGQSINYQVKSATLTFDDINFGPESWGLIGDAFPPLSTAPPVLPPTNSTNSCSITGGSSVDTDTLAVSESIPLVGEPFTLNYSSDRFRSGFAFSPTTIGIGGWSPSILHHYDVTNQVLYDGDGGSRPVQATSDGTGYYVSSQDAREVYYFDSNGNHLYTKDALTGVTQYSFAYDSQSRLSSITDHFGNVTSFQYSSGGVVMTSPYGQQTTMTYDSNGYLASVTNPNNDIYNMTYGSTGLLSTFEKPNGETSTMTYDSNGLVTQDMGAGGNQINLSQQFNSSTNTQSVTSSSALGVQTTYQTTANSSGSTHTVTFPTGEVSSADTPNIGAGSSTDSIGTSTTSNLVPDPRFGAMSPYDQDFTYSVANSNIDESTQKNIQATLANSSDPLSLTSLITTTELQNDPSRTSTETYTAATRTMTDVSPMNRVTTTVYNPQGEVQSVQVGNLTPLNFIYDNRGRLYDLSDGSVRNMKLTYDSFGNVQSVTNFLGQTTSFEHDLAGRVIKQIDPDGSVIQFGYDKNGDLTSITPPSRPAHIFSYNLFDLVSSYLPPSLGGINDTTTYSYNADKQLTEVDLPTGEKIFYNYDSTTGLLTSVDTPTGNYNYTYVPNSSLVSQLSSPDNETLSYDYAGSFVTNTSTQGPIVSSLSQTYNTDATIASRTPSGVSGSGSAVPVSYDNDGLIVGVGNLLMTRNQDGLVTSTDLKNISEKIGYDSFGEMTSDRFTYSLPNENHDGDHDRDHWQDDHNSIDLFNAQYLRDKLGRVVAIERSIDDRGRYGHGIGDHDHFYGGSTQYVYDKDGRLTEVLDGRHIERQYKYDQNGNRIEMIEGGRVIHAKYDAQDRLIRYGNISYKYDNNGALTEKIVHIGGRYGRAHMFWNWLMAKFSDHGDHNFDHDRDRDNGDRDDGHNLVTKYNFDVFGDLKSVTLPDGRVISYIYDGQNRLVGKEINGKLVEGFIYQSQTQVAAELDGQGRIVKQFIYGSKSNIPDYMMMNGQEYRIISNQVGTPLYVVNAETGKIVERERMDEFGYDEHAVRRSMLPFGFAGGIYDSDTGLVHFGARSYDPQTGRFVSKDPTLFNGGTTNLFEYSLNDPVNYKDPSGKISLSAALAAGAICAATGAGIGIYDVVKYVYEYGKLYNQYQQQVAKLQKSENSCNEASTEQQISNLTNQFQLSAHGLLAQYLTPSPGEKAVFTVACTAAIASAIGK